MRAAVALAALTLAGCEGGGDPVESALREAAAANHAAATKTTAETIDASAPAGAEAALVVRMIEAERRALAASEAALTRSADPEVRRLAAAARDAQTRRIAELEAWRRAG